MSKKSTLRNCILLFLLTEVLFLIHIQFPAKHNFDEFHYVPAAKELLSLSSNRNWEHPPVGKYLIALGITLLGDRPIGWRFMSTIFGALTLVGMYIWSLSLFRSQNTALLVVFLTLVNHLLYVQSRIGMLDVFMFAFMLWGMVFFTQSWDPKLRSKDVKRLFAIAGVCFGLAMGCKWTGVLGLAACASLICLVKVAQGFGIVFLKQSPWQGKVPAFQPWYSPGLWKGIRSWEWILFGIGIPFFSYLATFLPLFLVHNWGHSIWDLFVTQVTMYEGQLRVVDKHPYMSEWTDWAFLIRPIWFAFDKEGEHQEWVRGVILLGNPLLMWTGLLALIYCLWAWIKRSSREGLILCVFYFFYYFSFAIIPRKVSFYHYYYPAGMLLPVAVAFVFHTTEWKTKDQNLRWAYAGMALSLFVYFFPILAALKIPSDWFRHWMWFRSWI